MRRAKQAMYLVIGGFLLTATVVSGFAPGDNPEASGYNLGKIVIGAMFLWMTVRAVRRA
jgi:hypothetical protein